MEPLESVSVSKKELEHLRQLLEEAKRILKERA
jgi:hypothetical protein